MLRSVRVLTVGNMYPPHHLGGYELMWQSTVRRLRSTGHEVRVITTDYRLAGAGGQEDPDVFRDLRSASGRAWRSNGTTPRPSIVTCASSAPTS
jgi:hypothetical protein